MIRYSLQRLSEASLQAVVALTGYEGVHVAELDEVESIGDFGLPVFAPVELNAPATEIDGVSYVQERITLDKCIIAINQTKMIVRTAVQGRNGTVKEYIADGDYDINIRAVLVNHNKFSFPESDVNRLKNICSRAQNIELLNDLSAMLGITEVVIESYSIQQVEGFTNLINVEIAAVSDTPVLLSLNGDV